MTQLIPNGKQQFVDINGRPLVGGKVYFYSVGTTTPKNTFQDVGETILNTNPVILNARGQASIYGTGRYRQVVQDIFGVTIWDQVITDPSGEVADNLNLFMQNLANFTDTTKGADLVGLPLGTMDGGGRTVLDWIKAQAVSLYQFSYLVSPTPNALDPSTWDWTPAVVAAFATGRPVSYPFQPGGFQFGAAALPVGAMLFGPSTPRYTCSSLAVAQAAGALIVKTGSTSLFTVSGTTQRNATFYNCLFYGISRTGSPIAASGLSSMYKFYNCGAYNFAAGFGISGQYMGIAEMHGCHAAHNTVGFSNLIDSKVFAGYANVNGRGVNQQTGANDSIFMGLKNEFNELTNYEFFGSDSCQVMGGVVDRSGNAGMRIAGGSRVVVGGVKFRRNGYANFGTSESAHIYIEGANSRLILNGFDTATGTNDDGSGVQSPSYSISEGSGAPKVTAQGGNAQGAMTAPRRAGTGEISYSGVTGIDDACNFGSNRIVNGAHSIFRFDRVGFLAVGATDTVTMESPPMGTDSRQRRQLKITLKTAANATSFGRFDVMVTRNAGGALLAWSIADFVNPANAVAMDATGSIQLTFVSFAADASTFDITVKNNHATNTYTYTLELTD